MSNIRPMYFRHELEDMYQELLDESYDPVSICGCTYDAGRAYRLVDEFTFNICVNQWESDEFDEISFPEFTEEEIKHYCLSANQTMYCRKEDNKND